MRNDQLNIRPAERQDAAGIAAVLQQLVEAGKRSKQSDADFALHHYVAHPDGLQCHVAEDRDGTILGFQFLKLSLEGNEYGAPAGWAWIGTHISPPAARRGVGRTLFKASLKAAKASCVPAIEAFIGSGNLDGQAYYEAMGFRRYRRAERAVCKSYKVQ